MQLTLNIDPPKQAPLDGKEILLGIMRRIGPCRRVSLCSEQMPDQAWDSFDDLLSEGRIHVVGQVRFKGVVPEWHVDNVYAVKESA